MLVTIINEATSDDGSCTFAESASEFNLSVNPSQIGEVLRQPFQIVLFILMKIMI